MYREMSNTLSAGLCRNGSERETPQSIEEAMTDNEYLEGVLRSQTLAPEGPELAELELQRQRVTAILADKLGKARPTVRKGGSLAKHTMNREVYDLDLPTYFACDETG